MVNFKDPKSFFKVPGGGGGGGWWGVQIFPGGVQLLIPYRNPYNLRFSRGEGGGVWTPCSPPLDPHLDLDEYI